MDKRILNSRIVCMLVAAGFSMTIGRADNIAGYVSDPTGDSVDFAAGVTNLGASVNVLNVGSLATGALTNNAFQASNGVTLAGTGNFTSVSFGAGPSQGSVKGPVSTGEGLHAVADYIGGTASTNGTLTVSFATPVYGAGIFLIDLFNPVVNDDAVTIAAYSGQNGTGSQLGIFSDAVYNFQTNYLYFMGISSSGGDIGSIVLSQNGNPSGDLVGLGNIEYAGTASVPEPASIVLLGTILLAAAGLRRRLRG